MEILNREYTKEREAQQEQLRQHEEDRTRREREAQREQLRTLEAENERREKNRMDDATANKQRESDRMRMRPLEVPCFTGAEKQDYSTWLFQFKCQVIERGYPETEWGAQLMKKLGEDALMCVSHLMDTGNPNMAMKFGDLNKCLDARYGILQKRSAYANQFSSLKQEDEESYPAYYSRAELLSNRKNAGRNTDKEVVEQELIEAIIYGIRRKSVREAMLNHPCTSMAEMREAIIQLDTRANRNEKGEGVTEKRSHHKRVKMVVAEAREDVSALHDEGLQTLIATLQQGTKSGATNTPRTRTTRPRKRASPPKEKRKSSSSSASVSSESGGEETGAETDWRTTFDWSKTKCFNCGGIGHPSRQCTKKYNKEKADKAANKFKTAKMEKEKALLEHKLKDMDKTETSLN